jgi:hypothetical protein
MKTRRLYSMKKIIVALVSLLSLVLSAGAWISVW